MSRASVNANVKHPLDRKAAREFGFRVQEAATVQHGTMLAFIDEFGVSAPTMYNRLADPDHFTVGELRELRHTLGMNKAELVEWLRPLL